MLDEALFFKLVENACDELPDEFFKDLNLGVIVDTNVKHHPSYDSLLICGEYVVNRMGRQIFIYYGSFKEKYGHIENVDILQEEVRKIVRHEFTHHLERQAGVNDLEIKDEEKLNNFVKKITLPPQPQKTASETQF